VAAPVVIVVVAPAHALVVMMLLTVSHGLLFNHSRFRVRQSLACQSLDRQSLPTHAGGAPAPKLKRSPRHSERWGPNVVRLCGDDLVALS
jgi:hypothetical protein